MAPSRHPRLRQACIIKSWFLEKTWMKKKYLSFVAGLQLILDETAVIVQTNQLTLSQPGRVDYAHQITTGSPGSDRPALLKAGF